MENPLRVLIVEDNPSDAELMVRRLKNDGFRLEWVRVDDEKSYLAALEEDYDLILSDWSIPDFSGLRALKIACEHELDTPFIIISGSIGEEAAVDALHQGASDYLLKDRPERLPQAVRNALEQKRLRDQRKQAEKLLADTSEELRIAYDATLHGWSSALELREHETAGHSQRVVETTLNLARVMGIKAEELVHIQRGALLHDIGKMGIPDSILLKPGPLADDEWVIMRQHPVYAYHLLSKIPYLSPALDIPHYHHERWDGSGYPVGLKGEEIPLAARIFSVVDVWDALSHDRPYRLAWTEEKVIAYLKDETEKQFDLQVADAFLYMLPSLNRPS
jgi:response regulator RpfG family c-di-GMP phosphodiesterase